MDDLAKKFEKKFAFVSCLTGTVMRGAWFVNNGASHNITRSCDIFTNMAKEPRCIYVELRDNTMYIIKGFGSIEFQTNKVGIMEVNQVMFVPGLEKNLLSILAMDENRLEVSFMKGEVDFGQKGVDPSKR